MRSQLLSALVAVAAVPFTTASASSPPKPGACIRDDLFLRIISADKADRREVKAFCREYLGIPVATWYSTTVTPTETVQSTATAETTVVETTTITSVETVVSTSVQTVVVSTATYTIERHITERNAQPSSLSEILVAEYKPAALSSACSCLSLRKCTKKGGVFTASPTTTTVVSTLTVATTSVTSITEAATTTIGTTVTTGITTTTSVEPPEPTFSFAAVVTFPGSPTKHYLAPLLNGAGDIFYLTKDITKAVQFRIDNQQRLVFDSASFYGETAYVYYNTNWLAEQQPFGALGARPATGVAGLRENEVPFKFDASDASNLQIVGDGAALQLQLARMWIAPMEGYEWYVVYTKELRTANPQLYFAFGSFKAEYF